MRKTIKLFKGMLIAIIAVSVISCGNDDEVQTPKSNTIADFVTANKAGYSSLLAALEKAELVSVLNGTDKYTVFAPNNDAFSTFLEENGFADLNAVPKETLKQILLNHVVSGTVKSTDLSTGYVNTLSTATPGNEKMSMYVNTDGGVKLNGVSTVKTADKIVDNGVVHLVDKVIGLPTVVTFATADANFSTLVAALTRDDIKNDPNFVATLSTANGTSPAPFTVFAPTNDAFTSLLTELKADGLGDIAKTTLISTLQHHVVGGSNVTLATLTDGKVTTLGGEITASKTNGNLTDANGRVSKITATDVQAANGVIHVIDKVILPPLE